MSLPEPSDPNTHIGFHLILMGIAVLNALYGFAPLSLPLFGWVVARWVVMAVGRVNEHARQKSLSEWNGRYFAFDDQQIHLHWDDAYIWVQADDVFKVMLRQPDHVERKKIQARIGASNYREVEGLEGECFSEAGLTRYLASLPEEKTRQFRRWLEREVFPNIRRLQE